MELFCQVIKNSGFLGQQSIDTSRLIRRSLRCFYLGLAGAVPLFGIVMAILAIKLHREITLELRERWQLARLFVYWGLGAPLVWAYALALQPFGYLIPNNGTAPA
ncbi:MAG: hypothetical protein M1608_11950, partial [Candidatus Omnitrophica bacterium]|nr:hypothetical protein [Candidatus Omnitrophota bacterium]